MECYPTSHTETTEGGLKHNQLEESKTCETGSEHYLPVNQKHPASTDVWKSIKETVEKNRERNSIIQLLSRGSAPTNTSQRYSYVSVVEEQAFSSNWNWLLWEFKNQICKDFETIFICSLFF